MKRLYNIYFINNIIEGTGYKSNVFFSVSQWGYKSYVASHLIALQTDRIKTYLHLSRISYTWIIFHMFEVITGMIKLENALRIQFENWSIELHANGGWNKMKMISLDK